jgi:hypothetical protein
LGQFFICGIRLGILRFIGLNSHKLGLLLFDCSLCFHIFITDLIFKGVQNELLTLLLESADSGGRPLLQNSQYLHVFALEF